MSEQRPLLNKQTMGITEGLPLQVSDGGIEELRRDIQRLMDIEAIKQVKHAYCRCIDTCNLEELATLLHEDVTVFFKGGNYEWNLNGRQEYVDNIGMAFSKEAIGHHNAHHPEIQILSDTEATAMVLYWDRYLKVDGKWLIKDTRYERLYEINETLEGRPNLSSHYLGAHGPDAQF